MALRNIFLEKVPGDTLTNAGFIPGHSFYLRCLVLCSASQLAETTRKVLISFLFLQSNLIASLKYLISPREMSLTVSPHSGVKWNSPN